MNVLKTRENPLAISMGGKLSIYQHGLVHHYDVSLPVKYYGKRSSFGILMQEILATVWHMHWWVVYVINPKCVLPSLANFTKLPSLFRSSIVCCSASSRVITSRHLWYDMQALKLKLDLEMVVGVGRWQQSAPLGVRDAQSQGVQDDCFCDICPPFFSTSY